MRALPPIQKINFCAEYVNLGSVSAAAQAVGISYPAGKKIIESEEGKAMILKIMADISKKTSIDAAWIRATLAQWLESDPIAIIDSQTNTFKPLREWPPEWRKMISAFDIEERTDKDGGKVGEVIKIKFIDKATLIKYLGSHVEVKAFATQSKHEHTHKIAERTDLEREARLSAFQRKLGLSSDQGEKVIGGQTVDESFSDSYQDDELTDNQSDAPHGTYMPEGGGGIL